MNWSEKLRIELQRCAATWAASTGATPYHSVGASRTVLFERIQNPDAHANFEPASWAAIGANPAWSQRTHKRHSQVSALPSPQSATACELDSSNSSDALLMNCFCYPTAAVKILDQFGYPGTNAAMEFGFPPNVPLTNGRKENTEVDLRIGNLLIEAKLTEASFTQKSKAIVAGYRDFGAVFASHLLPQDATSYGGYQLIRNVLAAHDTGWSFLVLLDARRPDLLHEWWAVHSAILDPDLRSRCGVRTWQEVAAASPRTLQAFLTEKYDL